MVLVADNLQALNPIVSEALRKLDPKPLQELAIRCVRAGAKLLDINPGYLSARNEDRMAFMVEAVQEAVPVQLVLDSPNPGLLALGLAACRQKPILNALSLEERKLREIIPLAAEHGASLIILLMNEKSFTPSTMDEKIALALELREHALAGGLKDEDLIYDPVLPNLSWNDALPQVSECIRTVRMLAGGTLLPEPARTIVGVSNLRSGVRRRYPQAVDSTCLSALAGAGLHFALADALDSDLMETRRLLGQMCV
jgi:cobalamin-dependent methionine synthase I